MKSKKFQRPFALLLLGRYLNSLPFFSLSLSVCFLCFLYLFYLYLLSFHRVNKKKDGIGRGGKSIANQNNVCIWHHLIILVANLSAFFFLTELPFYYGITLLLIISFCLRNSPNYPSSFLSLSIFFFFFSFMGNKLFQVNATWLIWLPNIDFWKNNWLNFKLHP